MMLRVLHVVVQQKMNLLTTTLRRMYPFCTITIGYARKQTALKN